MFLLAGNSVRLALQPAEGVVVTADAAATVIDFATSAVISGIQKAGRDARSTFYGPVTAPTEVRVTAAVDSDVEIYRGSIVVHGPMGIATLKAAELAAPTAEILSTTNVTYQLDVAPYTRWRSDGTKLIQEIDAVMTGYVIGPNAQVVNTDTIFEAIGKLQAQINAGGGGGGGGGNLSETTTGADILETTTGVALTQT